MKFKILFQNIVLRCYFCEKIGAEDIIYFRILYKKEGIIMNDKIIYILDDKISFRKCSLTDEDMPFMVAGM